MTDARAKELIYDAVAADVVPARLLRPVHSYYFDRADDRPDCAPRSLWGLHNSFTRAVQVLPPTRRGPRAATSAACSDGWRTRELTPRTPPHRPGCLPSTAVLAAEPAGRAGPRKEVPMTTATNPSIAPTMTALPLRAIRVSPDNPRRRIDESALAELAASIREQGVLEPILVRPVAAGRDGSEYEVMAGERRYRAAKLAALTSIPAIIRQASDEEALQIAVVENLQRQDLDPIDEADGFKKLLSEQRCTVDALAAKVGKSAAYVRGRVKLAELPKTAKEALRSGKLPLSIALLVARIPNAKQQAEAGSAVYGAMGEPMSFKAAAQYIQTHFMLSLADASFRRTTARSCQRPRLLDVSEADRQRPCAVAGSLVATSARRACFAAKKRRTGSGPGRARQGPWRFCRRRTPRRVPLRPARLGGRVLRPGRGLLRRLEGSHVGQAARQARSEARDRPEPARRSGPPAHPPQ